MPSSTPLSKSALQIALVLAFGYLSVIAWQQSLPFKFDSYTVGEWLINYGGGLTRRGLDGFLLIHAANLLGLSPELMVFFVKISCFGVVYIGIAVLLQSRTVGPWFDWILLLSPCTFLFPALDRWGGGRKEILLLAILTVWALLARNGKTAPRSIWLSLTFFSLTMMHEGLFFFYPLMLALVALLFGRKPYSFLQMSLILLPSALLLLGIVIWQPPVTDNMLIAIAKAISPTDFVQWDSGAIETLRYTLRQGVANVGVLVDRWAIASLLIGWVMSLAPLYWVIRRTLAIQIERQFGVPILIGLLSQLPLYVMATDWGRWIYINASLLTIAYFALPLKNQAKNQMVGQVHEHEHELFSLRSIFLLLVSIVSVAVIARLTRIPHCCVVGFQLH